MSAVGKFRGRGGHLDELGDVDVLGKDVFATNVILERVLPAVHVAAHSAPKLYLQQVLLAQPF